MTYLGIRGMLALAIAGLLCPLGAAQAVSPAREAAIRAADAETGVVTPTQPAISACAKPPAAGEKLAGDMELASEGHAIEIENGRGSDALVKIRHVKTGKLAGSFYLPQNASMTIDGVPDGEYAIQYAFGASLAADCRSFTRLIRANAIPGSDVLKTETIEDDSHSETRRMSVSYRIDLIGTADSVRPVSIDAATFNAE